MEKGQSLIEVLVGLATGVLIIGAITAATVTALSNAEYGKNQALATNYAQQGMEIARNMRDSDISQFSELNGTYCLAKSCNQIDVSGNANDPCGAQQLQCSQNVGGENADIFVRQVSVVQSSTKCQDGTSAATEIDVRVAWFDSKCPTSGGGAIFCHNVALSTCLSSYNGIQAQ